MRKWIVVLMLIAAGVVVLFANRSLLERVHPSASQQAAIIESGDVADEGQSVSAPLSTKDLGGIDLERKRKIVNAASACSRADGFREMAAVQAQGVSNNNLASLSDVQRQNFEEAERQCSADPAARTAPADEFLVDLARAGNMAAASCYVVGGFRPKRHGVAPPDDPIYRQLVPELIERGIAAGDWRMVSLAAAVHGPRSVGSPFTYLPSPDIELSYLYTKLKELGARANEKADLQAVLAEKAKKLSPAEKKSAETRAESLYRAHFAQGPAFSHENQSLCVGF